MKGFDQHMANRLELLRTIIGLTSFKTLYDSTQENEFVMFADSTVQTVPPTYDRTAFEASENHVHLLDHITRREFHTLLPLAPQLGELLLVSLKHAFPEKHFIVYVSVHLNDSLIVRFHQKWPGELPFCDPANFQSGDERVFSIEG